MLLPTISSMADMVRLVNELGFLPFFRGDVPGFSIAEAVRPDLWFSDTQEGPWEWKGPVIRETGCAYGKFYRGKAMYVSRDFFPDFANLRRDGYDYDARVDDGLARRRDARIMELLTEHPSLVSRELKALACAGEESRKQFDGCLGFLQMQCYVCIADFEYALDRYGRPYGWGLARYATPEHLFGEDFCARVYEREPAESRERLRRHLKSILPDASEGQIARILE